jgi:gas vesicle protein
MDLMNLIKTGGYAMMLKEVAERVMTLRNRRRIAQRRQNAKNLLLGATIGTAAGAAMGLLFAPRSGRETRDQISQRTGETLDTVKARVSDAGERIVDRVQSRTARLRIAAEACSENIKDAVRELDEEIDLKGKKKK